MAEWWLMLLVRVAPRVLELAEHRLAGEQGLGLLLTELLVGQRRRSMMSCQFGWWEGMSVLVAILNRRVIETGGGDSRERREMSGRL